MARTKDQNLLESGNNRMIMPIDNHKVHITTGEPEASMSTILIILILILLCSLIFLSWKYYKLVSS